MASIPLHCNICPKEPDFSDVSHLLTHISSKGHLAHYFRAQVRARSDENVRYKVDIFEQWYNKYQIEKLLSQRMSAKQAKSETDVKIATSRRPLRDASKVKKPRGRRTAEKSPIVIDDDSPIKQEHIIDPQLSFNAHPQMAHRKTEDSPGYAASSRSRAPIPRMHNRQPETPRPNTHSSRLTPHRRATPRAREGYGNGDDIDKGYVRTLARSPEHSACADTSETTAQSLISNEVGQAPITEFYSQHSPILKGITYPGMSLFDAASREAQRLRNQKKHVSILEQMGNEAAAIEPMEHIYWPEGGLKKKRLITGNVESSPLKEITPPPKRPRVKASGALASLSTNLPHTGKKRGRKPTLAKVDQGSKIEKMADSALQMLRSVYPRNELMEHESLQDSDDELLAVGLHSRKQPDAEFSIYRDPVLSDGEEQVNAQQTINAKEFLRSTPVIQSSPSHQFYAAPKTHLAEQSAVTLSAMSSVSSPRPVPFAVGNGYSADGKENMPFATAQATPYTVNGVFEEPQTVTQRYFSVIGDNPPQIYNSMPPHMEFGGMAGRTFYGTFVNPLNAFSQGTYHQPEYLYDQYQYQAPTAVNNKTPTKSFRFRSSEDT